VQNFSVQAVKFASNVQNKSHDCLQATTIIQRRAVSYLATLVCPTLLTTFVSIVGFFMPASSRGRKREKMTLGINSLLTMSVLLLGVSDKIPSTSSALPLIGNDDNDIKSPVVLFRSVETLKKLLKFIVIPKIYISNFWCCVSK